jgi:hypothetical protein
VATKNWLLVENGSDCQDAELLPLGDTVMQLEINIEWKETINSDLMIAPRAWQGPKIPSDDGPGKPIDAFESALILNGWATVVRRLGERKEKLVIADVWWLTRWRLKL